MNKFRHFFNPLSLYLDCTYYNYLYSTNYCISLYILSTLYKVESKKEDKG